MAHRTKTQKRRCDNPQCGRFYRFEQTSSSTCSGKCRVALHRQRQADNEAEEEALAQFAAETASQEQMRKAKVHVLQERVRLQKEADEEERERYQQAAREEAEFERRRPRRPAPAQDTSVVTISTDHARYAGLMTPIPSTMKPGYL